MTHKSMQNKSMNILRKLKHYFIFIRMQILANDDFNNSEQGQLLGTCRELGAP